MRSKKLIVGISGGLGNQLFQLAAAIHLQNQGYTVAVDSLYNDIDGVRTTEIKGLAKDLKINYVERSTLLIKVMRKQPIRKIYIALLRKKTIFEKENFGIPTIPTSSKKNRIFGYWQTISLAGEIKKNLSQLIVDKSRDEVALHVRRGDYLSAQHYLHGALSGDYYLSALKKVREKHGLKRIVIFTDSPEIVKNEDWYLLLDKDKVRFSDSIKPWETIIEMAHFSSIVCSNSTFSWWAAFIGEKKTIIMPSNWFRDIPLPEALRLPDSQIIEGTFI